MSKKILYLLRHGKAAEHSDSGNDHARPLIARGREDAARKGQAMEACGWKPDRVLYSDAARTRETWALAAAAWGENAPEAEANTAMYLASQGDLLEIVRHLPEDAESVLLVGHNPGFHLLAQTLSASAADRTLLKKLHEKFPTSALARIEFTVGRWQEIAPGSGHLSALL